MRSVAWTDVFSPDDAGPHPGRLRADCVRIRVWNVGRGTGRRYPGSTPARVWTAPWSGVWLGYLLLWLFADPCSRSSSAVPGRADLAALKTTVVLYP